jgi:hypothetical protein
MAATRGASAQRDPIAVSPADRAVYLDSAGVIRWQDTRSEVRLFGANYVLPTASDYRAAGYLHADRKKMIDEDMAQFARMGWDGLRLTFWGDWESSDSAGNLIANEHLDLLDYLIARARARGMYMLFSPIQLYSANWPDAIADTSDPGFGRHFRKDRMDSDPAAIAAQANYLRQVLNHVNPYTGVALKDEPAILFVELVNEPAHHPDSLARSVRYIDTLVDAVRSTGCRKLIFYNVSQDFRIATAIRQSRAQGVTFGWYPTGLNSGHELHGSYLRTVDAYPPMLAPDLAGMPRVVYEFESPDTRTGYMYPAMARTFRSIGTQFVAMFAYDMLETASRNLGWQTHYLNMVYTPRKAVSAIIAAEAMRRLPRMQSFGRYPANTTFGDFHVSADSNLGELLAPDAFIYAGSTADAPPDPTTLQRIVGYGSSPLVSYGGVGIYYLDRIRPGVWRLEVYADAVPVSDPFEPPNPDKIVTRAISRSWPMTVTLPDLGDDFTLQPITAGKSSMQRADGGRVTVTPGVYVLSRSGPVAVSSLPAQVGRVGLAEYHAAPADSLPPSVQSLVGPALLVGRDGNLQVRIAARTAPDSAVLFLKPAAGGFYRAFPMHQVAGYVYAAAVPAAALREGADEYVVTTWWGNQPTTFPGGLHARPTDWDYYSRAAWHVDVVGASTPLDLFDPLRDAPMLAFSRIGDAGRAGLFHLGYSPQTGRPVFHLERPTYPGGRPLADYTASLTIKDRIDARRETIARGSAIVVRLRGLGPAQVLHLTLVESDGTAWSAPVTIDSGWSDRRIPLSNFTVARSVMLPEGFPGEWNYWLDPPANRGGPGDHPRLDQVERLQLSLRSDSVTTIAGAPYGVEIETIRLDFGKP